MAIVEAAPFLPPEVPHEDQPKLNFERYRELCSSYTHGSRKLGLLSEELTQAAMNDENAIFAQVEDIQQFPVLVPIDYVEGYDVERSKRLAADNYDNKEPAVYYFSLPPVELTHDFVTQVGQKLKQVSEQKPDVAIFYEHVSTDEVTESNLAHIIAAAGLTGREGTMNEPNAQEGFRQPAMFLHATEGRSDKSENDRIGFSIVEVFDDDVANGLAEKRPQNGTAIFGGEQLDDDLTDKLWDIYQDRFQFLGENHPISMEDTRSDFDEMIRSADTTLSISFINGEPGCLTFLTEDMSLFFWLDENYLNGLKNPDKRLFFFPGIATVKTQEGANLSLPTIAKLAQTAARTGDNYKIIYESTNLSEGYVPGKVVAAAIGASGTMHIESDVINNEQKYKLLLVNS